jgi:uncharacterized protein (DUF927 family)
MNQSAEAPVMQGLDQCRQFLKGLRPKGSNRELWVKFGHDSIYRATWDENGNLSGIATKLENKNAPTSRINKGKPIPDLIKHLDSRARLEEGGVFFIPTQPIGLPMADCVTETDDIGIEMDHLSVADQKALIAQFCQVTGLEFASALTSGGASIHLHLKADRHYPLEEMQYFRRLAVIAFQSDPVTVRAHQPMRLPGFFRKEKNAYQELLRVSDRRYTPDDLTCAFDRWFEYKGWAFPYAISSSWWSEAWRPLFASKNTVLPSLKDSQTKDFLAEGDAAYLKRRSAESEQQRERIANLPAIAGQKISDLVQSCCDRAGLGDFDGVDWQGSGGHYRGQCPFHEGKSGSSAWLSNSNGAFRFHCSSCTDDSPRTSFEFMLAKSGLSSIDSAIGLKGRDYVEAAKVFLSNYGVNLPEKPKEKPHAPIDQNETPNSPEYFKNHFESSVSTGLLWIQWIPNKKDPNKPSREEIRVGDHITALAFVDSPTKDEAQLYIEFQARHEIRTLTIKRSDLAGEGTEIIKLLNEHSYYHNRKQKALLLEYLNKLGKDCEVNYTVTNKTGWIQDSFVLPDRSFGNTMIRFQQVDKPAIPVFEEIGTIDDWKTNLAALCVGNSRLTFALGVSLSAPLNALLSIESGGYHFYGPTSTGKTSTLWVAASVYGQEKQNVMPWRTTSNALEYKAAARNNLALMLDEIGQCTAQDVAQSAYLLANGQGKARMRKDLTQREILKWNLTFLSNGEHTLSSYLEKGGIETKGGQENRMPSIPAVVQNGFGAFETCHQLDPSEFSSKIKRLSQQYCGTAFSEFMNRLVEQKSQERFESKLFERHTEIRKALTNLAPYNEVLERVADRMACVQLGLEMAIDYGILPHSYEDVRWSVQSIFCDWVNDRGGAINFELKQSLDKIENLFITQEFSDRILDLHIKETKYDPIIRNLLAYKRNNEFLVPPTVFNKDFVGELNRGTLITALIERGWLTPGADGKTAQLRKIDGKAQRVYVFQRFWSEVD